MPQGAKGGKITDSGRKNGAKGNRVEAESHSDAPADTSSPDVQPLNRRLLADAIALDCILANTRELKKLAIKAGFAHIALILEMAELEAADKAARLNGGRE